MATARTAAARLRGGFVGATSAAVAVAAHSVGGGVPPTGATVFVLVLACATVAAAATTIRSGRGLISLLAFAGAGQLVGHGVLTFASGHAHPSHWSPAMICAHVLAAVGCAVLIGAAERLCVAALGELRRLIVVTLDVADTEGPTQGLPTPPATGLAARLLVRSGLGTRAPPSALFA
jgi:hypothetical protein